MKIRPFSGSLPAVASLTNDHDSIEGRALRRVERHLNSGIGFAEGDAKFAFGSKEEFEQSVATIGSQMISARFKSLKKEMEDSTKTILSDFSKQLSTQLDDRFSQIAPPKKGKKASADGEGGDGGEGGGEGEGGAMLRTLKKQNEDMARQLKDMQDKLSAKDAQQKSMTMKAALREQLEHNGVTDPHRIKAITAIFVQDQKIGWDDDLGGPVYKDVDGAGIELPTGVAAWLKTPEGEHFAAPTGAAGAGTRPKRPANGATEQPKVMNEGELGLALLKAFNAPGGT